MPITFACDDCDTSIRVKDQFAGKKARCPKCGAVVRVPQLEEEERVEEDPVDEDPVEEAPRPKRSKPRAEEERSIRPRKKRKRSGGGLTTPFVNVCGIDL